VFAPAKHVIWDLRNNPTISFSQENPLERAEWWDIKLVDIQTYLQQSSAAKEVYKKRG
jgi:hypothetical protein